MYVDINRLKDIASKIDKEKNKIRKQMNRQIPSHLW